MGPGRQTELPGATEQLADCADVRYDCSGKKKKMSRAWGKSGTIVDWWVGKVS